MKKSSILRILTLLVIISVPLMASVNSAQAAALSDVSDIISDSGSGADSDHDISFKVTSGIAATDTINIKFDDTGDNFDLSSIVLADIDFATGTCGSESDQTIAAAPSGATWGAVVNSTTDEITFTSGSGTVTANDCVTVEIGVVAGGTNQITNPTTGIYDIDIVTTSDTGLTKVAIFSHVTVDVTVDETLTFTVDGQTTAQCTVNASTVDSSATSISYGSTVANTFKSACQELTVSTNAPGGYSVTVQQDGALTSAALDTIAAGTCDGACDITTAAAWATATNNGFAYIVGDVTGTDGQETTGYRTLGTIGANTPEVIMTNAGVVSGNAIEVNYKISISGSQPAGTYENDIVYVATPIY